MSALFGFDVDPALSLKKKLLEVKEPLETSATLPAECYTDAAIYQIEQQLIFRSRWISIGRVDNWSKPGDYMSLDIAEVPVIIVMDDNSKLRAFSNVCRHRGAKLLSGEGHCERIMCPFHHWTYALDGSLKAVPHMTNVDCFDKSEYGLIPIHLETRMGFVFINLDPRPESIDTNLGNFADVHEDWNFEDLRQVRRKSVEVNCNWKSFLEVFNEYYHLRAVHPNSIDGFYKTPHPCDEIDGEYTTQFGPVDGNGALLEDDQNNALPSMPGLSEKNRNGIRYTWLYPQLTFAASYDGVWVFEAHPLSSHKTRAVLSICFPQSTIDLPDFEQKVTYYFKRFDIAITEDIEALENQHQGLCSPLASQGRFCELMEPSVARFALWYARLLKQFL